MNNTPRRTHKTINVKPEVFDQLLELAELLSNNYSKVNLGELTGTLIKRELTALTTKKQSPM